MPAQARQGRTQQPLGGLGIASCSSDEISSKDALHSELILVEMLACVLDDPPCGRWRGSSPSSAGVAVSLLARAERRW